MRRDTLGLCIKFVLNIFIFNPPLNSICHTYMLISATFLPDLLAIRGIFGFNEIVSAIVYDIPKFIKEALL